MDPITSETQVAIMARMVLRAPSAKLNRTQLMKLCYFLQAVEEVPVQYDFRLFNYGPFDSEVLNDLGTACGRDVLKERNVPNNRGYAYEITPGETGEKLSAELEASNPELAQRVDRIVQAFAKDGAGELELKSTILFVDREFQRTQTAATFPLVAERVHSIKPHFSTEIILSRITDMSARGLLLSSSAA